MGERGPYQVLGVSESASFEEVQAARDRLLGGVKIDEREQQAIERAYDAILMQRLRLRQEGKIAVPEGIRYPDRELPERPPIAVSRPKSQTPAWFTSWVDTPSIREIWLPFAIMAGIAVLSSFDRGPDARPSWELAVGLLTSIYFLYNKERKFGRSLLLAFIGLVLGLLFATAVTSGLGVGGGDVPKFLFAGLTLLVMWVVTAFLR
jgi:hypothetical protein